MLLRNTLWSLMGEGLPMVAAVASIPLLIGGVGMERFGALTLLWALLGYLALLDLGLVRTLAQIVAERLGRQESGEAIAEVATPALLLIAGLGLAAGVGLAVFAGPLAARLEADVRLVNEVKTCLYIAAGIVPVALLSAALRGVLEAHQLFRAASLVRMSVGVLNYLSPLAVLPFNDSLPAVVAAVAVGRVLGLAALATLAWRMTALGRLPAAIRLGALRPLFAMGAWMMTGNLVGPVMMYADRFILGSAVAAGAIAYYTTPFEMVTRLLFFPAAIAGVLFPLAARQIHQKSQELPHILGLGVAAVQGAYGLALIGVAVGGGPLLELWLGAEFAANSRLILIVLTLGVLLNGMAYMPYVLLQGIGRVDVTAKLQLVELPVYLGALWLLAGAYGPLGAAMAWCLRTGVDLFLLLFLFRRLAPGARLQTTRIAVVVALTAGAAAAGLALGGAPGLTLLIAGQGVGVALAAALLLRTWRRGDGENPAAHNFGAT